MDIKEMEQALVDNMKRWQKVENESIASTGQIMQKTDNPVIRMVMEVIQRDSQMHYWIQGWIADTLEYKTVILSPDELTSVGKLVEQHIAIEKKMIDYVEKAIAMVKGKRTILVQQYFLNYLLEDEQKHSNMLESLTILARGMRDGGYSE